jgi:hypothetical protein
VADRRIEGRVAFVVAFGKVGSATLTTNTPGMVEGAAAPASPVCDVLKWSNEDVEVGCKPVAPIVPLMWGPPGRFVCVALPRDNDAWEVMALAPSAESSCL